MTIDQLATFLHAAERTPHWLLWLTLAETGMRPGEALALRWTDLDLRGRQVTVSRAAERGGRIKSTKTGRSRVVDLTPRLAHALDRQQAQAEANAMLTGRDASTLVFHDNGRLLNDSNLSNQFSRLCVRAGLPRFSTYSLRHSYASHLLGAGVPITYVKHQLGHSKPVTTLAFYAHYLPDESKRYADQLETIRVAVRDPQGGPPETRDDRGRITIPAEDAAIGGRADGE